MGLLGTVIGMIRSFAALSAGGGADSMALSQGISEALINTAFGILTGALAVISYNYYTNKIDKLILRTRRSRILYRANFCCYSLILRTLIKSIINHG